MSLLRFSDFSPYRVALTFERAKWIVARKNITWRGLMNPEAELGYAAVSRDETGHWRPATDDDSIRRPSLILGIVDSDTLVDLMAIDIADESLFTLATGDAPAIWPAEAIDTMPWLEALPAINLYESPWSWLRSGCSGAIITDWSSPLLPRALPENSRVICESVDMGSRLAQIIRQPRPPRVHISVRRAATNG